MTICDFCGTPIRKNDDCGTLVSGYAKATVAEVYGPDEKDCGEPDDVADFDPTGEEYMICSGCVTKAVEHLSRTA